MAYFRQQKGKIRAEVCIRGVRKSRVFKSELLAKEWAEKAETAIAERHDRVDAIRNATLSKLIPKRVLDALAVTDYNKTHILKAALPCGDHCGIYFLIHGDDVVYVGKSINIFNRIGRHRADGREFDSFAYLLCPEDRLDEIEAGYITALMPWMNIALGPSRVRYAATDSSSALDALGNLAL